MTTSKFRPTVACHPGPLRLTTISEPILRPPNDNFTNRIALTGATVVTNGANVLATREPDEPLHVGKLGDTSVWWSWTAPSARRT